MGLITYPLVTNKEQTIPLDVAYPATCYLLSSNVAQALPSAAGSIVMLAPEEEIVGAITDNASIDLNTYGQAGMFHVPAGAIITLYGVGTYIKFLGTQDLHVTVLNTYNLLTRQEALING